MRDLELTRWLEHGGDDRVVGDADGLNPYRASMFPRDSIPLGSCTASSMGRRGWDAAAIALAGWQASTDPDAYSSGLLDAVRTELTQTFQLPASTSICLVPSGTDALYLVSSLALRRTARVHHVVVGASELGGGTLDACIGRAFSPMRPLGEGPEGEALPGLADRCTSESIYLRASTGERLDIAATDAEAHARAHAAAGPDVTVIVHLVAHSKTGLRAPSLAMCVRLQRELGEGVLIMVDAAQGRLSPDDVCTALRHGHVVMFTGSKFYSGPPFSGALLVPEPWSQDPGALPAVLSDWFARDGLPAHWTGARASLRAATNLGLALRWRAAMAEITAYHAVPPQRRARVYATFAGAVHEVLGLSPAVELEFPLPPVHELATGLAAFPTVFGFRVRSGAGWMDKATLKRLHTLLDTSIEGHPDLLPRYHLGQPVVLGPPGEQRRTLLRVALGGRLVTDFNAQPDGGGVWMRETLSGMCRKIDRLVTEGHVGSPRV